jgi:two-component system, chemotaxis family, sensor histidine kinase and response regulator PixL
VRVGHPLAATVLIVDDEPAIREFFARALEMIGYLPFQAATAEQALRIIDSGTIPDAVLLDLKMPGIGGLGFLLRLRSDPRYGRIPVAIVTGDSLLPHPVQVAAERLNAQVHFKPIDIDQLYGLTTELLDSRSH